MGASRSATLFLLILPIAGCSTGTGSSTSSRAPNAKVLEQASGLSRLDPAGPYTFLHIAKAAGGSAEFEIKEIVGAAGGVFYSHGERCFGCPTPLSASAPRTRYWLTTVRSPRAHVISQYFMLRNKGGWCPLNLTEAGLRLPPGMGTRTVSCCGNWPEVDESTGLSWWADWYSAPGWSPDGSPDPTAVEISGKRPPRAASSAAGKRPADDGVRSPLHAAALASATGSGAAPAPPLRAPPPVALVTKRGNYFGSCYTPRNMQARALTCGSCAGEGSHRASSWPGAAPDPAAALSALARFAWVGVAELLEESVCLLDYRVAGRLNRDACTCAGKRSILVGRDAAVWVKNGGGGGGGGGGSGSGGGSGGGGSGGGGDRVGKGPNRDAEQERPPELKAASGKELHASGGAPFEAVGGLAPGLAAALDRLVSVDAAVYRASLARLLGALRQLEAREGVAILCGGRLAQLRNATAYLPGLWETDLAAFNGPRSADYAPPPPVSIPAHPPSTASAPLRRSRSGAVTSGGGRPGSPSSLLPPAPPIGVQRRHQTEWWASQLAAFQAKAEGTSADASDGSGHGSGAGASTSASSSSAVVASAARGAHGSPAHAGSKLKPKKRSPPLAPSPRGAHPPLSRQSAAPRGAPAVTRKKNT